MTKQANDQYKVEMNIDENWIFSLKKCESVIAVKTTSAFKLWLRNSTPPKHTWTREWLSYSEATLGFLSGVSLWRHKTANNYCFTVHP